jgi:hypothetical protein
MDGHGTYWEAETGFQGYFGNDHLTDPVNGGRLGVQAEAGGEGTIVGSTGEGLGRFAASVPMAGATVSEDLVRSRDDDDDPSDRDGGVVRVMASAATAMGSGIVTRDHISIGSLTSAYRGAMELQAGWAFHQASFPGGVYAGAGVAYSHYGMSQTPDGAVTGTVNQVSPYVSLTLESAALFDFLYVLGQG